MAHHEWRCQPNPGLPGRNARLYRLAVVLLMLPLYTGTVTALECPPGSPPLLILQVRSIQECTAPVQEPPEVAEPQQAPSCKVSIDQACPRPPLPKTDGPGSPVLTERGYGCDSQTGGIVGPESHKASSRTRCSCRHEHQCKRETEELLKDYEARVAARTKERNALYAQQQADEQNCKEEAEQARERAKRRRAEEQAEFERQRQACDRQAEQEAQRQAEAEGLRKEQAVKDHLRAFEAAIGRGDYDQAAGHLAEARGLDPDASGLAEAVQRLAQCAGRARRSPHEAK